MDALKAQFERIRQQLSALTGTQKMLVAALVAIMVLTMLYWGKFAQNAETVSLLGTQSLPQEDIGRITMKLDTSGVPYTPVGDKIMVSADRRAAILATLMYSHLLPNDTSSAFDSMAKSLSAFASNEMVQASFSQEKANELSDIISRFPGVDNARVVLNTKDIDRVEGALKPSATVFIATRGGAEDEKNLVKAAADGVAHAVSDLKAFQISVIINGKSMRVPDPNDGVSSDEMTDNRKQFEGDMKEKVRNALCIKDIAVEVTCDVENRTEETNERLVDKSKSFAMPKVIKGEETKSDTTNQPSREPGVATNTGGAGANGSANIDGGGGGGGGGTANSTTGSKDETQNEIFVSEQTHKYNVPAGKPKVLSAVVNIPLSYFSRVYKRMHPNADKPDEATLATAMTAETARIKESVRNVVTLPIDGPVSVGYYADDPVDTSMLAAAAAPSSAMNTVKGNAKEIGVGILAIVSLLMMASLVRKSAPPQLALAGAGGSMDASAAGGFNPATPAGRAALAALGTGEDVAGEVGAGSATLDAYEMDEDSVRTQQVLSQVSAMVKENPDGAAALVKRWLTRP